MINANVFNMYIMIQSIVVSSSLSFCLRVSCPSFTARACCSPDVVGTVPARPRSLYTTGPNSLITFGSRWDEI